VFPDSGRGAMCMQVCGHPAQQQRSPSASPPPVLGLYRHFCSAASVDAQLELTSAATVVCDCATLELERWGFDRCGD
jgi:hypothetical protein